MRRSPLILFLVALALALGPAFGQGADLAKQLPIDNAADSVAGRAEADRILAELVKLGEAGVGQVGGLIGTPDEAKAWFALYGLANYAARPNAEADRLVVSQGLLALIAAQTDPAPRNQLLQILEYCGKDETVAPVASLLADPASADYAARVLFANGSPAARQALREALATAPAPSLPQVVRALGELRDAPANAAILPLAASDDAALRATALYALAQIGDDASRDAMVAAATTDDARLRGVNTDLFIRWAEHGGAVPLAATTDVLGKRAAQAAGPKPGQQALLDLQSYLGALAAADTPQARDQIVKARQDRGSSAAAAALVASLNGASAEQTASALLALGRINAPLAADSVRAAIESPDAGVRAAAIASAALLRPAGPGILMDAMGSDRADVVHAAGQALGAMGSEDEVALLVKAVRAINVTAHAQRLLGRLGLAGGGAAWRVLGIFAADPILGDDAARALLAAISGRGGAKAALTAANRTALQRAAAQTKDEALRQQINGLVGAAGGPAGDTNLALGAKVFEDGDHEANQVPENAVDGQKSDPGVGWWTPEPASLTINLGRVERLGRAKLYTYWLDGRSYKYTLEASVDNKAWSLIYDGSQNTAPSTAEGAELKFDPVDAQFVRLNMLANTANASMHVVEIELYPAAPAGPANLAEGKPVSGTPDQEQDHAPSYAVDGAADNTNAGWFAGGTPATLTVDLLAPVTIDTTQTVFYYGGQRTYQWRVETSLDGETWTVAADRTANTIPVRAEGFVDKFAPVEARYVRLVVTKNSANPSAHVIEFRVFAPGNGPAADAEPVAKAAVAPPPPDAQGFTSLLYDKDLAASGWIGSTDGYVVDDNLVMTCIPGKGGNLLTAKEFANFDFVFDFKLTPGANNGVGIRTPADGNAAYVGMEIQILDDRHEKYKDIEPWQAHGSIYGVFPAKRDLLKPAGEWNTEEIIANGTHIKVIVNGEVAVDADLATVTDEQILKDHPGLKSVSGHIGFLGHGDELSFRNVRIKEL